jgi:succinate dehydrogenase / fumarate reductase flavoprotein subunit
MNVHHSDVLVVGGGFAGTWAAIRAAEMGARVLLVDKAVVSRSGSSTMSSGVTTGPTPDDDLSAWSEELITRGQFMCDQRWTRQMLDGQVERLRQLDQWGATIIKDSDGKFSKFLSRGMMVVRVVQYSPVSAMSALRARAEELGVTVMDRVSIIDLVTSDRRYPTKDRVCGAYGFQTRTGEAHCFMAKSVILASGPMAVKGFNPVENNTGDGMAMALKAGAEVVDAEFALSGTFSIVQKKYSVRSLFNIGLGHGLRLINRNGDRFMEKYDPERLERGELPLVVAAFVRELAEGRGPVYMDLTGCDDAFWENLVTARGKANAAVLFSGVIPDPREHPIQIEATRSFWNTGRGGPNIDLHGRTSIPGLYASGAVAKNLASGTHGSAGAPTAWAMASGYEAGEAAALDALADGAAPATPSAAELAALDQRVHEPLTRTDGISTTEALRRLHFLQGNILENFALSDEMLRDRHQQALDWAGDFARITATDVHDLVKAHEFANTHRWVGLTHLAMRKRTESRGGLLVRKDYPYTDDFEWRCFHAAVDTGHGNYQFAKLPITVPPGGIPLPPPRRYLDPAASTMQSLDETLLGRSA